MLHKLHDHFHPSKVSWRVGSTNGDKSKGMALAYIDARDVMARLDEVIGAEKWQDRYEVHGTKTICYISIKIGEEWVTKSDGAGDSDVEAEKGSISDAFKRAAVKWGIGRYLYDIDSPWVEIESRGKSYAIKKSEYTKLEKVLSGQYKADEPKVADRAAVALEHARLHANTVKEMDINPKAYAEANKEVVARMAAYPEARDVLVAAGILEE